VSRGPTRAVPAPLPLPGPVRLAAVGLGQIAELMLPAYAANPGVEVVGLCDPNPAKLERWAPTFPSARCSLDVDDVLELAALVGLVCRRVEVKALMPLLSALP